MNTRRGKVWTLLASKFGPLLALLLVFLFFAVTDAIQQDGGRFLTMRNVQTMLIASAPVVVAGLGMTFVIISGGIDLSAGTAVALCATVMAYVLKQGGPIELAFVGCLAIGCLAGSVNGIMISALNVAPFIVTLGTMTAYLGIAKLVADETTVRPPLEQTARLCGLNLPALKIAVYTLSGLFVGLAGVYQFSKLKVGNPTSGVGLELKVIAAVVIGGASLSGGRGTILGTLTGALLMQTIASGCTQLGLSNPVQDIILGIIIVAAVTVDQLRAQRGG
jgi:ribose transport system permease protein